MPGRLPFMLYVIEETLIDIMKLIPFLFLTYLAMEYLEHRTSEKAQDWIKKAGRTGPILGGLLGIVPQCGFSTAASNLYAGRVISVGTLVAIYLSTSDEMLPILISERASAGLILRLLLMKAAIGVAAGLLVDFLMRRKSLEEQHHIHDICEHEHCHCEKGVFRSALSHTAQITFFILLVTFALNLGLHFVGEDVLAGLILNRPVIGPILSGAVGLIPNCAGSVAITQLYLQGAMGLGAAMAGLLSGTGVGILVLFRMNRNRAENVKILILLYMISVLTGIVIGLF